jgi:hypothetical protein
MDYEDLNILTKDKINLHGWLIKQTDSRNRPTIVYFHENAGSNYNILYLFSLNSL